MPKNLLFVGSGKQHRPHPLKVKWSFPNVKSTVQITKLYIYFNYICRYLHIFLKLLIKVQIKYAQATKIYTHPIAT
jgi:hypothetical protein